MISALVVALMECLEVAADGEISISRLIAQPILGIGPDWSAANKRLLGLCSSATPNPESLIFIILPHQDPGPGSNDLLIPRA